jgi:DUF4097 and DUF4098 domain-containing protein YvlB
MKTLLKILPVFILFLFLTPDVCGIDVDAREDPYLTKEFTLSGPGNLIVKTSGGSITVSSRSGNKVVVEMYVRKGLKWLTPEDDGDKVIEKFEIDISQSSNTISAIAKQKDLGWLKNMNSSISFTVYVPENISTDLNTSGGSIRLSGVKGTQEVKTSGGSLELANIDGDMVARTSGGSINIESYAGKLDAVTSGGSINLMSCNGELDTRTSGGSIRMEDVSGSVDATTSGGGIHVKIHALQDYLRLKTSGGSISAVIPEGLGLDLDLKGNRVNTHLVNFNGSAEKNKIKGSVNGGGIPVVLATSGGSVNLEYAHF